jgi:aquaporin Z
MKSFEKQLFAEFLATFLFILIGCGTAFFAASYVGYMGIALTFGLALAALYSLFEKISGCHMNPAVTLSFWISKKIDFKTLLSYTLAQLIGSLAAAGMLVLIFKSLIHCGAFNTFATTGFGLLSPHHFGFWGCAFVEIMMTFLLCLAYLGRATDSKNIPVGVLGAVVVVTHFFALPITGAGLNPARSFGVAVVEGSHALEQVWFFFVMPMIGGALASITHKLFSTK